MADKDNSKVDFGKSLLQGLGTAAGGLPGAAISTGLNLLGGAFSANSQLKNQKKLMEYQSQLQKDMMQFQWSNQYGAQVAGMKGAGLNPALMQGGSFGLNSAPSVSGGSASAPQVFPTQLAQFALLNAQLKNVEADTKVKESEEGKNNAETNLLTTQEDFVGLQRDAYKASFNDHVREPFLRNLKTQGDYDLTKKYLDNVQANTDYVLEQLHGLQITNEDLDKRLEAILKVYISQYHLNEASAASVRSLIEPLKYYYATVSFLNRKLAGKASEGRLTEYYEQRLKSVNEDLQEVQLEMMNELKKYVGAKEAANIAGNVMGGIGSALLGGAAVAGKVGTKAALAGAAASSTKVTGF